jgi:hypothetical protein
MTRKNPSRSPVTLTISLDDKPGPGERYDRVDAVRASCWNGNVALTFFQVDYHNVAEASAQAEHGGKPVVLTDPKFMLPVSRVVMAVSTLDHVIAKLQEIRAKIEEPPSGEI